MSQLIICGDKNSKLDVLVISFKLTIYVTKLRGLSHFHLDEGEDMPSLDQSMETAYDIVYNIKMRVMIDTNVIFSGLYSSNGASYALLNWLFNRSSHENKIMVVSAPLILEYQDVLLRPENIDKLPNLTIEDVEQFVDDICNIAKLQKINFLWRPFLRDHKDDMVLETAFNGEADYIITHNMRDFSDVGKYFTIELLTPSKFLSVLRSRGELI